MKNQATEDIKLIDDLLSQAEHTVILQMNAKEFVDKVITDYTTEEDDKPTTDQIEETSQEMHYTSFITRLRDGHGRNVRNSIIQGESTEFTEDQCFLSMIGLTRRQGQWARKMTAEQFLRTYIDPKRTDSMVTIAHQMPQWEIFHTKGEFDVQYPQGVDLSKLDKRQKKEFFGIVRLLHRNESESDQTPNTVQIHLRVGDDVRRTNFERPFKLLVERVQLKGIIAINLVEAREVELTNTEISEIYNIIDEILFNNSLMSLEQVRKPKRRLTSQTIARNEDETTNTLNVNTIARRILLKIIFKDY